MERFQEQRQLLPTPFEARREISRRELRAAAAMEHRGRKQDVNGAGNGNEAPEHSGGVDNSVDEEGAGENVNEVTGVARVNGDRAHVYKDVPRDEEITQMPKATWPVRRSEELGRRRKIGIAEARHLVIKDIGIAVGTHLKRDSGTLTQSPREPI